MRKSQEKYLHIYSTSANCSHKTNVKILSRINLRSIRYLFSPSLQCIEHDHPNIWSNKKKHKKKGNSFHLYSIYIFTILISISFIPSFSIFVACFLLLSAKFISYRLALTQRCDTITTTRHQLSRSSSNYKQNLQNKRGM